MIGNIDGCRWIAAGHGKSPYNEVTRRTPAPQWNIKSTEGGITNVWIRTWGGQSTKEMKAVASLGDRAWSPKAILWRWAIAALKHCRIWLVKAHSFQYLRFAACLRDCRIPEVKGRLVLELSSLVVDVYSVTPNLGVVSTLACHPLARRTVLLTCFHNCFQGGSITSAISRVRVLWLPNWKHQTMVAQIRTAQAVHSYTALVSVCRAPRYRWLYPVLWRYMFLTRQHYQPSRRY